MNKEKTAQTNEQLETNMLERDTFINFLINLQERIEILEKDMIDIKEQISTQPIEIINQITNGFKKLGTKF